MPLVALGLNHQTAPLALRELVAFAPEATPDALKRLTANGGISEAAILSTCNRTELYCHVADGEEAAPRAWLHEHFNLSTQHLDGFLYHHQGAEAARHMFRVATGLDSMVLGEPQILGQLKTAYQQAHDVGSLSSVLDRMFQNAFSVAKRARTETRIGSSPVSVAFAAVRLASQIFADLKQATVLLIGAGDTIELAARHLLEAGVQRLLVANRTLANAQTLAAQFGALALPLADLDTRLMDADIVIASTASREPVLSLDAVKAALKARKRRPMFMLDLAVPRDIEASVGELEDVYLYTIDDIGRVIDESLRSRREAAVEAEAIIDLQVGHFMNWCQSLDYQGPLRALRDAGFAHRDEVLGKARHLLANGRSAEDVLQFLAHTLTNKLLHAPTRELHAAAERGDAELLRAAERLFADLIDRQRHR
ncbi:MAG: glutamyl-tRNA reductase [Lysobacterales bacterium CG02_land_8_20_14_3_00_62_12]|nr:MAG: glutamyl-tRNA reductase [Xanthomonadales bacterium CG02_land_8_20_14_3_00_62_12]PJA42744.1 MAG: glutamyl-tRNA reductase [Xanthomonadales bacterium CG_4_9_14_3_um_filter_62_6]